MDFYDFIKARKEKIDEITIQPRLTDHPLIKQQVHYEKLSEIWTNLNTNHGLLWLYQGQEREDWRDHDSATSHWSSVDKTTSPLLATHVHESVLYGLTLQKYIQAHNLVKNRHHLELTNIMSQNINYGANNIQAKTLIVADKT